MCLVWPCVVRRRKGTICFFNVSTMVGCGSWFRIGLVLLRRYLVMYILMLISFVLLEDSQRTLGLLLLLFGFLFYLLFGKIATEEFFKITLIILKLSLKGLNFKRIGGWKQTTFCLLLTILFGDKTSYVVYRLSCNVLSVYVSFWLLLALLVCN